MAPDHLRQPVPLRPAPLVPRPRYDVPRQLTSVIGREADVAAVGALLSSARLLTLLGPGGVGKTRLALCVAEQQAPRFADGVVFVPLSAVSDADLLLPEIMHALNLRQGDGRSAAETVTSWLQDRHLLLVLDNTEQIAHAGLPLGRLLAACPLLSVAATSRTPLQITGEQRFPVLPLALPPGARSASAAAGVMDIAASPAVQLFVARAQAVQPAFIMDAANAPAVADVCRQLDGLPLAIELAAARSTLLSPQQLRNALHVMLPLLEGGPLDAPLRLQTMRNAIAWSYALLIPAEQRDFRWAAIFAGDFDLTAAAAVLVAPNEPEMVNASAPELAAIMRLARLAEKSLLICTTEAGNVRYSMLETIRAFGQEMLEAAGERVQAAERHAAWCTRLAEETRRSGALSRRAGIHSLEAAHPNLRQALAWLLGMGRTLEALHLAAQLAEFWLRRGYLTEGQSWLERALAADHGPPTVARAEALVGMNMLLWPSNAYNRAAALLANAEQVARTTGDAGALAYARLHQGYVAAFQGNADLAIARGEEALTTVAAIPQGFSLHGALWLLAHSALVTERYREANDLYQQLLERATSMGDEISLANSLTGLAYLAEQRGNLREAVTGYARAAHVAHGYEDYWFVCGCLDAAGLALTERQRPETATQLLAAADALRSRTQAPLQVFVEHRERHHRALTELRAALGREGFAAAWAAGSILTTAAAIALAGDVANALPEADDLPQGYGRLTIREREVLRYVERGWSDKEIAADLAISRRTVSNHIAALRAKLHAPSRSAAVAIAVRDHLI